MSVYIYLPWWLRIKSVIVFGRVELVTDHDRAMEIREIRLIEKSGGKSGIFKRV